MGISASRTMVAVRCSCSSVKFFRRRSSIAGDAESGVESICAKPAAAIRSISSRVTSAGFTPIVRSRTFSPRCAISQQMLSACPGGSLKTESTNSNATSPRRSRTCWISSTTLSAGRQRKVRPSICG